MDFFFSHQTVLYRNVMCGIKPTVIFALGS